MPDHDGETEHEGLADELMERIRRVLREDVGALLAGAADPAALTATIRGHLTGLLGEADDALRRLRAEAERWQRERSRAEQDAAVETQLMVLASEQGNRAVVVAAEQRIGQRRAAAAQAQAQERRVSRLVEALLAVVGSLRAMLARLTSPPSAPEPPGGSDHFTRAAKLAAEIDVLNERAFQKVREARERAVGQRPDSHL